MFRDYVEERDVEYIQHVNLQKELHRGATRQVPVGQKWRV